MRLPVATLAAIAAALLWPLAALSASTPQPAEARVIVTFKPDAPLAQRMQALAASGRGEAQVAELGRERASLLGQRAGLGLRGGAHISERRQVFFAKGIAAAQLVRRLAADSQVESVVIDQRRKRFSAPNDPLYADGLAEIPGPAVGQWYLRAPVGAVKSSIDVEPAWALAAGRPEVVVAVLDTGVRFDHADLAGRLLPGYDMISDVPTANDGNGRDADPSDPGDYVTAADKARDPANFGSCDEESSSWHGTQTASLVAAATDNNLGMASVGRGNVRVLPLRVLGKCGGYDSDIQAAMRWAAGLDVPGVPRNLNKAAVVNLSLGSTGACDSGYPAVVGEVIAAGTAVVAAAGNTAGHSVGIPANCPGVIAVAGLRHIGTKVGFSDLGPEIAISAPGGNCVNETGACLYPIITALNSGTTDPVAGSSIYSNSFDASVGTSFSAPMVAATAALMVSVQPALQPADLRRLLQASARPFPTSGSEPATQVCRAPNGSDQLECYCTTSTCGAGMLDAGAAVQAAQDSVIARIDVSPAAPLAGQTIDLNAGTSVVPSGHTVATVKWAITNTGGIVAAFASADNASTAQIVATADGSFSVSVTVTDNFGVSATTERSIVVGVGDPGGPPPEPVIVGGGGGGAVDLTWLGLLAAGVLAAMRPPRRERQFAQGAKDLPSA